MKKYNNNEGFGVFAILVVVVLLAVVGVVGFVLMKGPEPTAPIPSLNPIATLPTATPEPSASPSDTSGSSSTTLSSSDDPATIGVELNSTKTESLDSSEFSSLNASASSL